MTKHSHDADRERVQHQNQFTDFAHDVEDNRDKGGLWDNILRVTVGVTPTGQALDTRRSKFDSDDLLLNDMLDMVAHTNPAELESSGTALWNARDAIKKAASELDGHVTRVHWAGESGDSFRDFGKDLVTYGEKLSDFAGSAGDQLSAASMGLSSVKSAMPERDSRPLDEQKKRPTQFASHEQVDSNAKYAAAVKAEKNRQEAINQMNRLSSYYVVSASELETLNAHPPQLRSMPDVGVPKPKAAQHWSDGGEGGSTGTSGGSAAGGSGGTAHVTERSRPQADGTGGHVVSTPPAGHTPTVTDSNGTVVPAERPVGTEIDSVGTLPPPTTTAPPTGPSPVPGSSPVAPSVHAYDNGYVPPMGRGTTNRSTGPAAGPRAPFTAQGRPGGGPGGTTEAGTTRPGGRGGMGETGRSGSTGRSGGPGGPGGSSGKASPAAGGGISGGSPRATGGQTPRAGGGTGAGRSNGVVGGRPQAARPVQSGSRIPRGSVMGAEGGAGGGRSTAGSVGQRGVFGGPGSAAKPTGANAARAERNGMTRGGSGLVRGPGKQGEPREEETDAAERPDYVVEDVNTHLPANRRDVPPVVN
ncbi:hypothetical protein [Streptomyces sp. NPDC016845]|uniref:hypothetical protein n=1 Tax=Streptomyces sp. NPDC016845 TaxID=3364972 RepID=UPI0037A8C9C7